MATTNKRRPLTPAPQYTVHDKQREVLESDARYRVCRWGRRAGKNVTGAIDVIEYCRTPWESKWGPDDPRKVLVWWVGPTYDQANKHGYNKIKSAVPNSWIADYGESKPRYIEFTTGPRVEFRTFDRPKSLQGEGVDRIVVDEADQMAASIWQGDLDPMLLDTKGSALFISKPYRPRSWFNRFYDYGQSSDKPEYESWHATSADNPFLDENPQDKKGSVPMHIYEREYLAELPDDGGQVFRDMEDTFFTGDYELSGNIQNGIGAVYIDPDTDWVTPPFSVGMDIARSRDYRVTIGLDSAGHLVYFHRNQNESWAGIKAHAREIHDRYPGILVPDQSQEKSLIADMWNLGIEMDPVQFSPQAKKDLIENLITAVEQGELTAPDTPLLDRLYLEMQVLESEVTRSGYTKYHAPEGEHDDCVDSLALAYRGIESAGGAATETATVGEDRSEGDGKGVMDIAKRMDRQMRESRNKWR